jgi:hypothetical protein
MNFKYVFAVIFGNPYQQPPRNLPRRLFESSPLETSRLFDYPRLKDKLYRITERNPGYVIGVNVLEDDKPIRRWSDEAKWRNRRKRLEARVLKKFTIPDLYRHELETRYYANHEYYGLNADLSPMELTP